MHHAPRSNDTAPHGGALSRRLAASRDWIHAHALARSTWLGASVAVAIAALLALAIHVWPLTVGASVANWPSALYLLLLVSGPAAIALGVVIAARLLFALPWKYLLTTAAAAAALLPVFEFFATRNGAGVAVAWLLVSASLVGGGIGALLARRHPSTRPRRVMPALAIVVGLVALTFGGVWLVGPGKAATPRTAPVATAAPLDAPDPSRSGTHTFSTFTYGSGDDRHRLEYAGGATLRTARVDGSKFVEWPGRPGDLRRRFWGFDTDALPLQGRVWMPDGDGPFPLVVAVHGNHLMEDFSDAGYAYLGEQLASRGFIFVSVDQNFLNTGAADLPHGKPDDENDARGWLLLEHLRQWHAWNATPDHRLAGRIDTSRIALVGHSRGGEAVALAAAFNRMSAYPDDALVAFDYGYAIRAVAAIAPVDGQYRPGGLGTQLRDVSYFTLQGGHDGDMFSFDGVKQYERVRFSDGFDGFRAALHFGGGNHGQFNTDWGRYDITPPFGWLLNVTPILPADAQRRIAQVYLGAFLEATLHDDSRYLPLFRTPQRGAAWLPETVYATEFEIAGTRTLAAFNEDVDPGTATWPGARIHQQGLRDWSEARVSLRRGPRETRAARLGWSRNGDAPHYAITLPEGDIADGMTALRFSLADTGTDPSGGDDADNSDDADAGSTGADDASGINLSVRLTDRAGNVTILPLSAVAPLARIDRPDLFKSPLVRSPPRPEPAFQTYALALDDFAATNPAFDRGAIAEIAFVFDRTRAGVVLLANVGLEPGGPPMRSAGQPPLDGDAG